MSASKIDLRGQWFHRLYTLRPVPKDDPRNTLGTLGWFCLCTCGAQVLVRTGQLRNDCVKSCGCLQVEARQRNGRRMGEAKRGFHGNTLEKASCVRGMVFEEEEHADDVLHKLELAEELKHLVGL